MAITNFKMPIVFGCLAISAACSTGPVQEKDKGPSAALKIAIAHVDANLSPGISRRKGDYWQYVVEDRGDSWGTEMGPMGAAGGGARVVIRKSDMKVTDARPTL